MKIKFYWVIILGSLLFQLCNEIEANLEPQELAFTSKQNEIKNARLKKSVTADFNYTIRIFDSKAFVTFKNTSRFSSSCEWKFSGATPQESTLRNPTVIFTKNGTFNVTLISKRRDKSKTITKQIVVRELYEEENIEDNVTAHFFVNIQRIHGESVVNIHNRSTNATVFKWSFLGGNPEFSSVENPTVVYTTRGKKEIIVMASNGTVSAKKKISISL